MCSYDNGHRNTQLDKPRLEDKISYQAYSNKQFGSFILHRNGIMVFSAYLQTNNVFSSYFCYYTLYSLSAFLLAKSQQLINLQISQLSVSRLLTRLDFRRLPGPVFDPPSGG